MAQRNVNRTRRQSAAPEESPSALRSRTMRAVRSRDTSPELVVRKLLRNLGFRGYRLHRKELPGRPDVAFLGIRKAIFIHGCFWHGHDCPRGNRVPATNTYYWVNKIERNRQRDYQQQVDLSGRGWSVLTLWECELGDPDTVAAKLSKFLSERKVVK